MKKLLNLISVACLALTMVVSFHSSASAEGFDETIGFGVVNEENSPENHFFDSRAAEIEEAARKGTLGDGNNTIYSIGCMNNNAATTDSSIDAGGNLTQNCDNSGDVSTDGTITAVTGNGGFGNINATLPSLGN